MRRAAGGQKPVMSDGRDLLHNAEGLPSCWSATHSPSAVTISTRRRRWQRTTNGKVSIGGKQGRGYFRPTNRPSEPDQIPF